MTRTDFDPAGRTSYLLLPLDGCGGATRACSITHRLARSPTIRTARSRTRATNLLLLIVIPAPSHIKEPPVPRDASPHTTARRQPKYLFSLCQRSTSSEGGAYPEAGSDSCCPCIA
jgi:hypothetical protein